MHPRWRSLKKNDKKKKKLYFTSGTQSLNRAGKLKK
jgi:hypothetical protein